MKDREYYVQLVVIREVKVEATDELQAEREAYKQLSKQDRGAAIALRVLNRDNPDFADADLEVNGLGGALAFDDPLKNWVICKKCFDSINLDWVQ